jgi:hypothetical protein
MHGKLFMIRKKDVDARRSSELRRIINRKNVDKLETYLFVQKTAGFHFATLYIFSISEYECFSRVDERNDSLRNEVLDIE